jgi:uncharacterized phage-associated protein
MISALDVAWYFVERSSKDRSVTQLKLQKLCYYAYGFYIATYKEPLFTESIEAWDYGPVVPELRKLHISRGMDVISPAEIPFGKPINNMKIMSVLDKIWNLFGHNSAGKLVDMTHSEAPWIEAYDLGQNTKISEEAMHSHFLKRANELVDYREPDAMEDPIADVFLKDGQVARVPLSQVDQFIENNKDILKSRKIKLPGPRRVLKDSSNI